MFFIFYFGAGGAEERGGGGGFPAKYLVTQGSVILKRCLKTYLLLSLTAILSFK